MYKKLSLVIILMFLSVAGVYAAGKSDDSVWQKIDDSNLLMRSVERLTIPERYSTFRLNKTYLQTILISAPQEAYTIGERSDVVLTIPMPDGTFEKFAIKDSPIMEAELAAEFPEIKTYLGQGIDNPTATVRFDFTPQGFHAMILSDQGTIYVDPYAKDDTENYISYNKAFAVNNDKPFVCLVGNVKNPLDSQAFENKTYTDTPNIVVNSGTLRTYRLALAATQEYTATVGGGTVNGAMVAMTTTMNRVNGIYERELSLRMNFIAANSLIIYTAEPDPYTNNNGSAMLGENTLNLNAVIGSSNFDIGHVFSTGGGGVAVLNSPCTGSKARGVTGLSNPTGDPFDVDYVAHEMGHQWGGSHTFNGSSGSCSGNRSGSNAYEPGSGTTIQAYAGICSPQNTQRNSDDYFHVRSLEQMVTFISGTGNCSVNTANGNTAPTVTVSGGTSFNIPRDTPFSLTAIANDTDGDALTYNWEEYSLGSAGAPSSTANAPMFRTYKATASPTRTFPSLTYILNNDNIAPPTYTGLSATGTNCGGGTCITGEFLSSITRTMPFQVTVRDNRAGGGGIRSTLATVNVNVGSGPFKVTAQDSFVAPNWQAGTQQTVTWDVAGTNTGDVSAANVSILLSTDGGQTFPTVLAASTPNDGTEQIMVPNITTTMARLKVQAVGNIFFDISNVDFTIVAPTAAGASVSGRVVNSGGRGISRTFVKITNASTGEIYNATTNQFGYFKFEDLEVGNFYTLSVSSKRYNFPSPTQSFTLNENLTGISFVGF